MGIGPDDARRDSNSSWGSGLPEDDNGSDRYFNDNDDSYGRTDENFIIINTNARSLCPKIDSLVDCFDELGAHVGVITETWIADGEGLEEDLEGLELGAGLGMICRNRPINSRGFSHGGVAVVYRSEACSFVRVNVPNPDEFEVVVALGTLPGHNRKLVTIGCYIPPGLTVPVGKKCLDYVTDVVLQTRRKYRDPYLVVAGDFNQWDINSALLEYPDITEADVGPTRGTRCLDKIFVSFGESVKTAESLPPLETTGEDHVRRSDHRIAHLSAVLPRMQAFKRLSYSYRYQDPEREEEFGQWLVNADWSAVFQAEGSNQKADRYQEIISAGVAIHKTRTKTKTLSFAHSVPRRAARALVFRIPRENNTERTACYSYCRHQRGIF